MLDGRMHQTTVRFGVDVWEELEAECRRLGVSAAQYLREAVLARLMYASGRRGERAYEAALATAGAAPSDSAKAGGDWINNAVRGQVEAVLGQRETTTAVIAQSEHARARSRA